MCRKRVPSGSETWVACVASETGKEFEALCNEAALVRPKITSARSDTMVKLFDYLLERTMAGQAPKEMEIFHAVFAKRTPEDSGQDSTVRVYMHRLRGKLDDVYADRPGARLIIPKGEYRILLIDPAELNPPRPPAMAWRAVHAVREHRRLLCIIALAFLLNIALWVWKDHRDRQSAPLADSFLWRPFAENDATNLVVAGDHYLIGEQARGRVTHLVRDFSINSKEDLEIYLMNHPEDFGRYTDVNLNYMPISVASALNDIIPAVKNADRAKPRSSVIAMSHLNPDLMRKSNVIYVGLLSGLGILRDPLFEASGFEVGATYDELIDRATGKHYIANWGPFDGETKPQIDIGYMASLPGPSGNPILVIAGTRDAAVMQMAEVSADPGQLEVLQKRLGGQGPFEALFRVRSIGNMNVDSALLLARRLTATNVWTRQFPDQQFPDSDPQTASLAERRRGTD